MKALVIPLLFLLAGCDSYNVKQTDNKAVPASKQLSSEQLRRHSYVSVVDGIRRDAYIHLPGDYDENSPGQWPVLIYLHGDGERGNGRDELDYVMGYGPLYEAWVQKKEMPFILVVPQLPMFGRDGPDGPSYIRNRTKEAIPRRQEQGAPPHNEDMPALKFFGPMKGSVAGELPDYGEYRSKTGWKRTDPDIISLLDAVLNQYNADASRVYMTGASAGAFGTWYYASTYPERFAALLPVVGYPTVKEAEAVARAGIPVWVFSGGRDPAVKTEHFFEGMNRMDALGASIRFTTEQDMFHDVWNRVYAGDDVYNWLLKHQK